MLTMSRLVSSTQQVGIGREYEYLSKRLYFYKTCKVGLTCFASCLILDSQRDGLVQGVCESQKTLRIIVGRSRFAGFRRGFTVILSFRLRVSRFQRSAIGSWSTKAICS